MQSKKDLSNPKPQTGMPLRRINYILLLAGCALILLGFGLMVGGKAADPNSFNPSIFSFRRITLAPMVIVVGFALDIVGIMYRRPVR